MPTLALSFRALHRSAASPRRRRPRGAGFSPLPPTIPEESRTIAIWEASFREWMYRSPFPSSWSTCVIEPEPVAARSITSMTTTHRRTGSGADQLLVAERDDARAQKWARCGPPELGGYSGAALASPSMSRCRGGRHPGRSCELLVRVARASSFTASTQPNPTQPSEVRKPTVKAEV